MPHCYKRRVRTRTDPRIVGMGIDAIFTKGMSAGNGDWLGQDVGTQGAREIGLKVDQSLPHGGSAFLAIGLEEAFSRFHRCCGRCGF